MIDNSLRISYLVNSKTKSQQSIVFQKQKKKQNPYSKSEEVITKQDR